MSVVPTSAAAAIASTAAATERASKVATAAKESDQNRRTKNGKQTGDRVVLSVNAVPQKQGATDRSEDEPGAQQQEHEAPPQLDVEG
ncbi:MAG: hypothetical protein NCW75_07005 [Phycisphaera sp.]|nr:MAG: hypothetical protein NCW75_07005 [Phycisphaera sp.]